MLLRSAFGAMTLALLATISQVGAQTAKPAHLPAAGGDLPQAKPESVGFSTERLARLDAGMKSLVDSKKMAGMVTVLARHGKIVEEKTYGYADVAGGKPMQKDTIVRIYSMTKPITGIAMMMLYEEGKWKPSDPIARYIPEFRDLKVFSGVDQDGKPTLDKPAHAPTMGELMSHSAGFTYGYFGSTPVDKMYRERRPPECAFAAGIHRTRRKIAAALSTRRRLGLQRFGRHPRLFGRKAFRQAVCRLFARAHLRAPGHERYGILRPSGQTRARRQRLSKRRHCGRGAHAAGSGHQPAAGHALRRRRPVFHGAEITCVSRKWY